MHQDYQSNQMAPQSEQMIKEFGEEGWELVSVTILSELHYELERFEKSGKSRTYEAEMILRDR